MKRWKEGRNKAWKKGGNKAWKEGERQRDGRREKRVKEGKLWHEDLTFPSIMRAIYIGGDGTQ